MVEIRTDTNVGLYIKCQSLLSDLIKIGIRMRLLVKLPNIKFHENPPSGSRVFYAMLKGVLKG
jgi:hypothetical protein